MAETHVALLRKEMSSALPTDWRDSAPDGYPQQIELALVAAVFRGADEPDVAFQVTARYMQARPGKRLDDLSEMGRMTTGAIGEAVGPPFDAALAIGSKRLRVDIAGDLAASLSAFGVKSAQDFLAASRERGLALEKTCTDVSHSGPSTYLQLATLLRAEVRPAGEVASWVREAVREPEMSRSAVRTLLRETAAKSSIEPFMLHYAILRMLNERAVIAESAALASGDVAAKKPAAKKAPARKSAVKKPAAKKAPARKSAVKKPAAKKAPARKSAVKKPSATK